MKASHTVGEFSGVKIGEVRPFRVEFPAEDRKELETKLGLTRLERQGGILPQESTEEDEGLRPSTELLHTLVQEWQAFDYDAAQEQVNTYAQFLVDIDWCRPLHFLHHRSSRKDAIPLILIHGWPGSFHEFFHVIERLCEPKDETAQAFHVVIPSLPGFAYSCGPPSRELGNQDGYSRIFDALMMDVLGYTSYAAQGGDWGSAYARTLGAKFCRSQSQFLGCRAVHLNFSPVVPMYLWAINGLPEALTVPALPYIPGERGRVMRKLYHFNRGMAYYWVQALRPAQLAPGLTDSPVGLLAWLSWFWALQLDTTPTFNSQMMLTICTIYFITRSIGTSFLPYHNNQLLPRIHADAAYFVGKNRTKSGSYGARLAYSDFPKEILNMPFAWLRSTGDLQFYAKATSGGHFAALEEPEIFANHLRLAFANDSIVASRCKNAQGLVDLGLDSIHISGSCWPNALREAIANGRTAALKE